MLEVTDIDYAARAGFAATGDELRIRLACEDLVLTTLQLIDDGEARRARPLFTKQAAHTVNDAEYRGEALTQFFSDREAMEGRVTRHTVMNLVFRQLSADRAVIRSICVVYLISLEEEVQRRIPRGIVDFVDTFELQQDGRWLICRREATLVAGER